ncbi:uncharacterized protein LOC130625992 [Hydractinia symbiolongicarpus]|uniref:uncharacterized protein LOC130625992 n=1 Tax=Hydractinia symbiolongicarpus TaxID=13093 RepID=UPI002550238D|nr:uncharacterized protein LOC130625992 [Hydractinia symbiolongicarpus]
MKSFQKYFYVLFLLVITALHAVDVGRESQGKDRKSDFYTSLDSFRNNGKQTFCASLNARCKDAECRICECINSTYTFLSYLHGCKNVGETMKELNNTGCFDSGNKDIIPLVLLNDNNAKLIEKPAIITSLSGRDCYARDIRAVSDLDATFSLFSKNNFGKRIEIENSISGRSIKLKNMTGMDGMLAKLEIECVHTTLPNTPIWSCFLFKVEGDIPIETATTSTTTTTTITTTTITMSTKNTATMSTKDPTTSNTNVQTATTDFTVTLFTTNSESTKAGKVDGDDNKNTAVIIGAVVGIIIIIVLLIIYLLYRQKRQKKNKASAQISVVKNGSSDSDYSEVNIRQKEVGDNNNQERETPVENINNPLYISDKNPAWRNSKSENPIYGDNSYEPLSPRSEDESFYAEIKDQKPRTFFPAVPSVAPSEVPKEGTSDGVNVDKTGVFDLITDQELKRDSKKDAQGYEYMDVENNTKKGEGFYDEI